MTEIIKCIMACDSMYTIIAWLITATTAVVLGYKVCNTLVDILKILCKMITSYREIHAKAGSKSIEFDLSQLKRDCK